MSNFIPVGITGVGAYAPVKKLTNFDLEKIVDTTDEWITTRTGIKERKIASENEATSDLAVKAAQMALEDAKINPSELDLIIVASVTHDMWFPATACIVQDKIGAKNAAAFDLEAGCSGFIYGMIVGSQFISSGSYKKVLVIGSDTLSKITDWKDRNTCILFGDGAGAAVLEPAKPGYGLLSFCLGAEGKGGELLKLEAGGSRLPATKETVEKGLHYLQMSGNDVFKFAVKIMEEASLSALEKAGIKPEQVDLFIPHQANIRIIEAASRRLKLPSEKVFVNVDKYGNTSCASVPLALHEAVKSKRITPGSLIVLVAFGAGLTWASAVIRWGDRS